ncbi:DUF1120 domain-containing protein [Leclercia tamurae]|uniref:Fimbrial protein n=1 Tax=Leclercia tamurae TaxID=2926467 RepID=A0ABT2R5J5_9ENTR|nr:hypothetical protein [Leclercia tamurae]MCU6676133.1 hypothetical protein [Leclercia tamurae]
MKAYLLMVAALIAPTCSWAECQLISSQQKVTYSKLSAAERQQAGSETISLPEKQIQLQVVCSEPHRIRLLLGSNLSQNGTFSLGEQGEMLITASSAYVDDQPVRIALVQSSDAIPQSGGSDKMTVALNQGLAFMNGGEIHGKTASVSLTVASKIKPGNITERTTWRGNLNIKLDVQ